MMYNKLLLRGHSRYKRIAIFMAVFLFIAILLYGIIRNEKSLRDINAIHKWFMDMSKDEFEVYADDLMSKIIDEDMALQRDVAYRDDMDGDVFIATQDAAIANAGGGKINDAGDRIKFAGDGVFSGAYAGVGNDALYNLSAKDANMENAYNNIQNQEKVDELFKKNDNIAIKKEINKNLKVMSLKRYKEIDDITNDMDQYKSIFFGSRYGKKLFEVLEYSGVFDYEDENGGYMSQTYKHLLKEYEKRKEIIANGGVSIIKDRRRAAQAKVSTHSDITLSSFVYIAPDKWFMQFDNEAIDSETCCTHEMTVYPLHVDMHSVFFSVLFESKVIDGMISDHIDDLLYMADDDVYISVAGNVLIDNSAKRFYAILSAGESIVSDDFSRSSKLLDSSTMRGNKPVINIISIEQEDDEKDKKSHEQADSMFDDNSVANGKLAEIMRKQYPDSRIRKLYTQYRTQELVFKKTAEEEEDEEGE